MNLTEDPRFTPGPNSPAWLAAMGEADQHAERYFEALEAEVTYGQFLDQKAQLGGMSGFEPLWMPSALFDFQFAGGRRRWRLDR